MLAVIRIRGTVGVSEKIRNALESLGLRKINTMVLVDKKKEKIIKKINSHVAWGELDSDLLEKFNVQKVMALNPPKGGYRSTRKFYPKGDLGYRGKSINELIRKMI